MSEGTRCSCGEGHKTFGECLRAKGLNYNGCFPTRSNGAGRGDATAQKKWDSELQKYRDARAQGIQPATTRTRDIERAERMSQKAQKAYDATDGTFK